MKMKKGMVENMKQQSMDRQDIYEATITEYGKQKILSYAESFRELARTVSDFAAVSQAEPADRQNYLCWRRMHENRELLSGHLMEMAQIMTEAAEESYACKPLQEKQFKQVAHALKQEGILVKHIYYVQNEKGRTEIGIMMCLGKGVHYTAEEAADMLSVLLGTSLEAAGSCPYFIDEEYKIFTFVQAAAYTLLTGVAKAVKETETVSGDNYAILESDREGTVILLSDGMGSGEKACADSEAVVDFMEKLLEAGFSGKSAVQMVNSAMVMRGEEQNMSTLDECRIDVHTGIGEFTKIGAASSYIKRGHMVEQISARNLPLGIFHKLEPESVSRQLLDGDYVVMISDGILDGMSQGIGEEAFTEVLSGIETENPGEMANQLLSYVIRQSKGRIRDDMTVLVIGIWEKVSKCF